MESGTDEFFGLDTTTFKKEGFAAGFMNKLSKFYEDTGKDYVSDLYSDAMSDYFGGLVQVRIKDHYLLLKKQNPSAWVAGMSDMQQ